MGGSTGMRLAGDIWPGTQVADGKSKNKTKAQRRKELQTHYGQVMQKPTQNDGVETLSWFKPKAKWEIEDISVGHKQRDFYSLNNCNKVQEMLKQQVYPGTNYKGWAVIQELLNEEIRSWITFISAIKIFWFSEQLIPELEQLLVSPTISPSTTLSYAIMATIIWKHTAFTVLFPKPHHLCKNT